MSLASLLLGLESSTSDVSRSAKVDDELDAMFRSDPRPIAAPRPIEALPTPLSNALPPKSSHTKGSKRKREEQESAEQPPPSDNALRSTISARKDKKRRRSVTAVDTEKLRASEDEGENDAQLEDSYLSRGTIQRAVVSPVVKDISEAESSGMDDDNAPPPAHETHSASGQGKIHSKSHKKAKYVPPDETAAQRDARTVFVGNIPVSVAKSKSSQKQLKRHFLTLVTGSKIESIRFRSVAFASATTVLPTEDTKTPKKEAAALSTKQLRQHDRAARWRDSADSESKKPGKRTRGEDETSDREDSQSHAKKASSLTPAERKRVAFIKGEYHKEVDTVNAYIVFGHFKPFDNHESTAATSQMPQIHPFEAARQAVEQCDGTVFMDRTMRVDRVGKWRIGIDDKSGVSGDDVRKLGDPRATLFVGNLDFAAKEEDLRVWFEGVVSRERGPPPLSGEGEGKDSSEEEDDDVDSAGKTKVREKIQSWVRSIRIVRDRDTQLGKGFAYVRFSDRECVDEILSLESSKLKFAKRKLRVQRSKLVPGSAAKQHKTTSAVLPRAKKTAEAAISIVPLPKGDPLLGEKLAGLSKDERKAAKAANADRVKRRLAKKKARDGVEKAQGGKDRKRERSRAQNKNGGKAKVVKKARIRSDKSLANRNAKK